MVCHCPNQLVQLKSIGQNGFPFVNGAHSARSAHPHVLTLPPRSHLRHGLDSTHSPSGLVPHWFVAVFSLSFST